MDTSTENSIATTGPCGKVYHFKTEYGGEWMQCPTCRKIYQVPDTKDFGDDPIRKFLAKRGPLAAAVSETEGPVPVWQQNYIMNQVVWSLAETYEFSENVDGPVIGLAERDDRFANFLIFALLSGALMAGAQVGANTSFGTFNIAILVMGLTLLTVTLIALRFKFIKRDIVFWADSQRRTPAFRVRDMSRIEFPKAVFRVEDPNGHLLAVLKKSWWGDVLQSPWRVEDADGKLILIAKEESVVLSFLRRLFFTKLWWFRINYVLHDAKTGEVRGEFRRDLTLRDRYTLDLSSNPEEVDLRILWALSVLLDSAERR